MKNICQRLLLYCTLTTCCYLSILLCIQYLLVGLWGILDNTTSAKKKSCSAESVATLTKLGILLNLSLCMGYLGALYFKDTINPLQLFVEKCQFFNQNYQHHISLNSQFNVVLNGIICFSVQFCNNSLLLLKCVLRFFLRVFQWKEDVNVVVLIVLLSTKRCLSFLKFQLLVKIFGEMIIMYVKSTSFPKELW